jgi:hypothetical protein
LETMKKGWIMNKGIMTYFLGVDDVYIGMHSVLFISGLTCLVFLWGKKSIKTFTYMLTALPSSSLATRGAPFWS